MLAIFLIHPPIHSRLHWMSQIYQALINTNETKSKTWFKSYMMPKWNVSLFASHFLIFPPSHSPQNTLLFWDGGSVSNSSLTLCNPMNCSMPGSSVHGISQARILEWVAIFFSRASSWSRDRTYSRVGRWIIYHWATRETR